MEISVKNYEKDTIIIYGENEEQVAVDEVGLPYQDLEFLDFKRGKEISKSMSENTVLDIFNSANNIPPDDDFPY